MCLSGCATGGGGSLATRFVNPGEPAVDYGGPDLSKPLQEGARPVVKPPPLKRPEPHSTLGSTVEGSDPRLGAALLAEAVLSTAETHLRVAEEYRRLGILDAACARLERATAMKPRLSGAHEALARVWRDWGLPARGLGSAYRAVFYDPQSASAWNSLGTVLAALGAHEAARGAFERAVSVDAAASWALNNLCYLDFVLGRLADATAHCRAALTVAPTFRAAHNNFAMTLAASGDLAGAQQEFSAAGDTAAADYNVGIVLLAQRDFAGAAAAFERAITARPTFTAAKARAHDARVKVITGTND